MLKVFLKNNTKEDMNIFDQHQYLKIFFSSRLCLFGEKLQIWSQKAQVKGKEKRLKETHTPRVGERVWASLI